MSILTFYKGTRGISGIDGEDGAGADEMRGSLMDNPVMSILNANNKSKIGTVTSTRATQGAIKDRYSETGFSHPDTATNKFIRSNDFSNAAWIAPTSAWSYIGTTTDPFGGSTAHEINLDVDTHNNVTYDEVISQVMGILTAEDYTISVWIKLISGTVDSIDMSYKDGTAWRRMNASVELGTEWTRISDYRIPSGTVSSKASFNPRGNINTRIALYGAQLETGTMATDYIDTVATPVAANYTDQIRQNNRGYLIERAGDNRVLDPNGFDPNFTSWSLSSGTLSGYSGSDPWGNIGQQIQIDFSTVQTITLSGGASVSTGSTYTASAYFNILSGTVTDISISLGGGVPVSLEPIPTESGFVRLSAECIVGSTSGISISFTSPEPSGASVVCSSIQVEDGDLTSYYDGNRAADSVSVPYIIPSPGDPWTVHFNHFGIIDSPEIKYVFYNNLGGLSRFNLYFQNDDIILSIGTQTATFSGILPSSSIAIGFDGSIAKIYKDGSLFDTSSAFTPSITTIASVLFVGSDNNQQNSINAHLFNFEFWDKEFKVNEAKYIAGKK